MNDVHFYLKTPNESVSRVYMAYWLNSKKIIFYPGLKCKVQNWSPKKERFKRGHPYWAEGNALLDKIKAELTQYLVGCKMNGDTLTAQKVKDQLRVITGKDQKVSNFFEFVDKLIEERTKDPAYTVGSIKNYVQAINKLKAYQKATKKDIDFNSFDVAWLSKFITWCYAECKLSRNTVAKHVKRIKTFLNEATERGYNENLAFRSRKFTLPEYEPEFVWLSLAELKQLKAFEFEEPHLEKVRDCILVACFTGLRVSDFVRIGRNNIYTSEGVEIIRIYDMKSRMKKTLHIPVHPIVSDVLLKYDYDLPFVSPQKTNDYIKQACRLAGINEKVTLLSDDCGVEKQLTGPKWQFVSTHTGRRSLITNWLLMGEDIEQLRKMTGQSTAVLLRYNKVTAELNAVNISKNEFWRAGNW